MPKHLKEELSVITDDDRPFVIEWLRDRSAFHSWSSSLITGSFVAITIFGERPSMRTDTGVILTIALVLMLFALLCNLVCVWSIPSWKYRVSTKIVSNARQMRLELAITSWLGVIAFVSGLTFAMLGNMALK